LCDSRITRLRGGTAIRCSVRLGRLMAVRFGAGPALQKRTQRIRLLAQFRTLNVPNGKNWRKLLIQVWQREPFSHLLANPLVVGERGGASRHKERLQEFLERFV